ncbi:hypothetical protein F4679DRAFT_581119 [Xylaria curta]|nr:hypothetical protein F4679DRAFT_581119 [Xylaria curta]
MSYHLNAVTPDTDDATALALLEATTTAVSKSNAASQAMQMGRLEDSISLHRAALEIKLQAYPESSIQVAITYNGLGEAFLRSGRLDEADEVLQKALVVRERDGPALDAAATRENIGALREAQGRFEDARNVRLRGAKKGHMLCSNEHCPITEMLPRNQLKTCADCQAPFYCSKDCQKLDWKERHKPLCKLHKSIVVSKTSL